MEGDYPNSLMEFEEHFNTEEACLKYIQQIRWPDGFVCPRCHGKTAWLTKRYLFNCTRCGFQTSITAGTIFHGSRKPLRLWFRVIWHITSQKYGGNALGMQRIIGFGSYRTAWEWLHKLRRAMVRPGRERLSGIVEVDEIYVGGSKPGKRGRGAEGKALVVIGIELKENNKLGRIRLQRVIDASANQLNQFVKNHIAPGSVVQTDGWLGYEQLVQMGYIHEIVREKADIGENEKDMLPHAHLIASLLKRWLLGTYQGGVQHKYLGYYLDEYTFRFNRRTSRSRGMLFFRLIQQAVQIDPVLRKEIKGVI